MDALALQVPAGAPSPTTTSCAPTPSAATTTPSTSCSTPACSTTTGTSTSRSTTPRRARRPRSCASPCATAATVATRRSHVLPTAVVPQHVVVGPAQRESRSSRPSPATAPRCASPTRLVGELLAARAGRRRAAVLRERDEQRAALRARRTPSPYVKDGVDRARRRTARPTAVNGERGHEGRRRTCRRSCPRAARCPGRCGSTSSRPSGPDRVRRRRRGALGARQAEADEFYASITPPALDADKAHGDAPGARRDALEQAALLLRPRPVAARARRPPAALAAHGSACATPSGSTWSTTTSSRCPTSGSTPGTPRGTSPSTPSRSRWSTPTSPRASST